MLDQESPLDLQTLITDRNTLEVLPEEGVANVDAEASSHFVNLPETMMICLNRFAIDPYYGQEVKITRPIQTYHDGIIYFTNNKIINENLLPDQITTCEEKVGYRIDAAICHEGRSLTRGHYVCQVREEIRPFEYEAFEHSDEKISEIRNLDEVGRYGCLLKLTRVTEKRISTKQLAIV